MKILMLARSNLFADPGGDSVQMLRTAEQLREMGVQVDVNPAKPDYNRYDLLHFFNIIDPEDILGHIRATDRPFVVSTIYVQYEEYERYHRNDLIGKAHRRFSPDGVEYLKTAAKWILKGESISDYSFLWRGHRRSIQYILHRAACLLPNSENEYRRLREHYGIDKKYIVAPNGVELKKFRRPSATERDIVLCVGRIEGRKNMLNLIRAVKGADLQLFLIGQPAPNQQGYYQACRAAAGDNVHLLGRLPQEALPEYYARARVHALPSWFETTGLVSLEAAWMGCNVVVGDRGDVRDYFGKDAWYCDPGDPASIRKAVFEAYEAPVGNEKLIQRIREQYNWKKAAEKTLQAYEQVLQQSNRHAKT